MAVPPQTYTELRAELQERMESLAPGQRRVAQVLLTDPESTAFRTIAQTARAAGVHQSSLVRFAALLGLPGYPALVRLCRAHVAEQAQLVRRFERAGQHGADRGLLAAVAGYDQQNLVRTLARIRPDDWERAVRLLAAAPRVHVMGLRKCLAVAQLMTYLLHLVRPDVRLVAPVSGGLVDDLRDLRPDDVFVAVSIHRYTADTVRALRHAQRRGLRTVVLTDGAASPLARDADVTFYVETTGATILRSLTGFVCLVQALSTAVALTLGASSRAELQHDEELLTDFDVYLEPDADGEVERK